MSEAITFAATRGLPTRGQISHLAAMPELTDRVVERRYRLNMAGLEALGADESVAQLASSVILHLEKHSRVPVEQHETLALVGLLNVLAKNLAARAKV